MGQPEGAVDDVSSHLSQRPSDAVGVSPQQRYRLDDGDPQIGLDDSLRLVHLHSRVENSLDARVELSVGGLRLTVGQDCQSQAGENRDGRQLRVGGKGSARS